MTMGGVWTYSLDNVNSAVQALNVGGVRVADTFTVTTVDGTAQVVTITIQGTNDGPVAVDDTAAATEDTALSNIDVLGNDTDVDIVTNGQLLSVSGTPTALHGTVTVNPDGTLKYTPDANYHGADTITYTVSDGNGGIDTGAVAITVNAVNDAPVAVDDTATATEDTALSNIDVLGNDTDVDIVTNGQVLSVSGTPTALHGTVTVNPDGTLRYTPDANYNGADTITYTVSDGNGGIDTGAVAITVNAVNDAPTTGTSSATVSEEGLTVRQSR